MTHAPLTEEPRKATWFELFFDLVFVVAVANLASAFSHHYDLRGAAEFAFLFLVLWWLWLGHTFHASRFDRDRPDQWALGFAHMMAVVLLSYGAGDAFGARAWAFACGVAGFKALLMLGYLREIARPGLRRLCTLYGLIYAVQAALWLASAAVDPSARLLLWALALGIDLVSPFVVAGETHRAPPHPEHLPERFGLFTIILLGETAAAAVHALDHGDHLDPETAAVALLGAALGFLYWVGYFTRAKGQSGRQVADAAAGRSLRLWAYGHVPLYLGIASLGAGTPYLAHHTGLEGAAPWVFAAGAGLAMVGVTIVSLATAGRPLAAGWPFFAIAALAGVVPALAASAPMLLLLLVLLCLGQILTSVLLARRA